MLPCSSSWCHHVLNNFKRSRVARTFMHLNKDYTITARIKANKMSLFTNRKKKKSHQCMKMSRHQCTYKDIEDSTKKEIKTTAIKILLCTIWVRITHIAIRPQYPQSGLLWSRWGVASLGSKNQMICII